MGLNHLIEASLPHLLGWAQGNPALLKLAVAGGLFACGFAPAFVLILIFRTFPTDDRSRSHGVSATGVPFWAQPLLLLMVFPLSWIWELLDGFAHKDDIPGAQAANPIFLILPCLLIVVAVHEMGHIFAAKALGFRVHRFRLGPFVFHKRPDGWRMRFELGSETVKSLPSSVDNLRADLLFMIAAGPAASLLFSLITVMAIVSAHGGAGSALGSAFGISATLSFLVFAASIWPARTGTFMADGACILALVLRSRIADRICASYACASSLATDRRPRDWDAAWVSALIADDQPAGDEFSGSLLAYLNALDSGRMTIAGAFLDRAAALADKMPPAQLQPFLLESAYFEARHRDNAVGARQFFDRAGSAAAVEPYRLLRCEAAVLLAEDGKQQASRALELATKALGGADRTGFTLAEHDLVRDLKMRLESLQVA